MIIKKLQTADTILMEGTLKNFNFYRSYRLKISPEDDMDVRVHLLIDGENEVCPTGKFEVVDFNYNFLSLCSSSSLAKGDQLTIKLSLKRLFSKWDIFLKGVVVRSFCDRKGFIYGVELEENLELKYFLKEFVSRFSQKRLRKQVIESSIFEKRFNPQQGVEIYSMLVSFVDVFFRSKNKINISQALREVCRILQCEEANIYLIKPDIDKLQNTISTSGSLAPDKDFREGLIGSVFTHETMTNVLQKRKANETHAVIAVPILNKSYQCIGVLELKNTLHIKRFGDYHEKIVKMLGHIFSALYTDYSPISGSSVIAHFNPKIRPKLIFLGHGTKTQDIQKKINKLKYSPLHLHLSGEEGTGKTHLAKHLHYEGSMRPYELLALDMEKETFFELATLNWNTPGTIIIENIDALKKVHHNHLAERVKHGKRRVITTSKVCIQSLYKNNQMTPSLYQQLTQQHVHLPPLRNRIDEVMTIARQLLQEECDKRGQTELPEFSLETLSILEKHYWPQNLKELKLLIKKALLSADHNIISFSGVKLDHTPETLIDHLVSQSDTSFSGKTLLNHLENALKKTQTKKPLKKNYDNVA